MTQEWGRGDFCVRARLQARRQDEAGDNHCIFMCFSQVESKSKVLVLGCTWEFVSKRIFTENVHVLAHRKFVSTP